jgi:hypothetical protein
VGLLLDGGEGRGVEKEKQNLTKVSFGWPKNI